MGAAAYCYPAVVQHQYYLDLEWVFFMLLKLSIDSALIISAINFSIIAQGQ